MRVEAAPGAANAELVAQGWRTFLVKVRNDAGTTAELRAVSPQAQSVHDSPAERTDSDKYYRKNEPAAAVYPEPSAGWIWSYSINSRCKKPSAA